MRPERATAEVGLGLAALGRPGYINLGHGRDVEDLAVERMERAAHDVLDAAYEEGVRAFDAARSYGRAEAFLASWLERRGLAPGDVQVSSKWGYSYTAGWRVDADEHEVKELTAAQLRRQWRESSALLGDHLGLYQIHSATIESGVLEDREVQRRAGRPPRARRADRADGHRPAPGRRRSSRPWRPAASTPCRPRGTCTSARPRERSQGHAKPGCTSSSRRRWRTGG